MPSMFLVPLLQSLVRTTTTETADMWISRTETTDMRPLVRVLGTRTTISLTTARGNRRRHRGNSCPRRLFFSGPLCPRFLARPLCRHRVLHRLHRHRLKFKLRHCQGSTSLRRRPQSNDTLPLCLVLLVFAFSRSPFYSRRCCTPTHGTLSATRPVGI